MCWTQVVLISSSFTSTDSLSLSLSLSWMWSLFSIFFESFSSRVCLTLFVFLQRRIFRKMNVESNRLSRTVEWNEWERTNWARTFSFETQNGMNRDSLSTKRKEEKVCEEENESRRERKEEEEWIEQLYHRVWSECKEPGFNPYFKSKKNQWQRERKSEWEWERVSEWKSWNEGDREGCDVISSRGWFDGTRKGKNDINMQRVRIFSPSPRGKGWKKKIV